MERGPKGNFTCTICKNPCGTRAGAVKSHYSGAHKAAVEVTFKNSSLQKRPRPRSSSPLTSLPSDFDMEDDDFEPHAAAGGTGNRGAPGCGDEGSDWDGFYSDASTEIMDEDDDYEVVPTSFTLSTSVQSWLDEAEKALQPPPGHDGAVGGPGVLCGPGVPGIKSISIPQLQNGLTELLEHTWRRLLALTGGEKVLVELPESLSEDFHSTDACQSFLDNVTTKPPVWSFLPEISKHSGVLLSPRKSSGDCAGVEVDPEASRQFFEATQPIVEAIFFLLYTTASWTLQLPEVVGDRCCEGLSPRNLFISRGVVFLLRRNVIDPFRRHQSSVVHFPPPKVVELIVYYLAVIRPIEIFLTGHSGLFFEFLNYTEFFYVVKGRRLACHDLATIIERYTDRYCGCRLNQSQLQRVLVNIQGVLFPPPPAVESPIRNFGHSQAHHTGRTSDLVYGRLPRQLGWGLKELEELQFLLEEGMKVFFYTGLQLIPN